MPLNINVDTIFSQKLSEIQGRVPLKIRHASVVPFEAFLEKEANKKELVENIKKESIALDTTPKDIVFHSPVQNIYNANYPILTEQQINLIMPRIENAITENAEKYGVDSDLVRAVVRQESDYQPWAVSKSGAQGLMQLMPGTAEYLNVTDPYNIEQNIRGGTQYLRDQINTFDNNLELALAAYNAGPNAVKKYEGIPPYDETINYVKRVLDYYNIYQKNTKNNLMMENTKE